MTHTDILPDVAARNRNSHFWTRVTLRLDVLLVLSSLASYMIASLLGCAASLSRRTNGLIPVGHGETRSDRTGTEGVDICG